MTARKILMKALVIPKVFFIFKLFTIFFSPSSICYSFSLKVEFTSRKDNRRETSQGLPDDGPDIGDSVSVSTVGSPVILYIEFITYISYFLVPKA